MKKLLLLGAMAVLLVACEQKETKEQTKKQEVVIPQNAPSLPMPAIPIQTNGGVDPNAMNNSNGPVLKLEEGKPLDFSQLQKGGPSVEAQVAAQIDSIRYKAEHGDAKFQYAYGVCYEKGWGVEKDLKDALAWYTKAAEQNNGPAYNSIGNLYRTGSGVVADPKQAFAWYQKGADAKDDQAMLNLGNCYYYGMGTEKDEKAAVEWWRAAAEAGNAYAMAQMGDCYYFGLGVEKNLARAIDFYTPAADKNITSALYRLGILYYTGNGVDQDQTYAKLLMQKARDGGMQEAQEFLNKNFQ